VETDTFFENDAFKYLESQYPDRTITAEVDEENAREQRATYEEQTRVTVDALPANAPAEDKYDYLKGAENGEKFITEEDSVTLPNNLVRPNQTVINGVDIATGEVQTAGQKDTKGFIGEGVEELRASKSNTVNGAPIEDSSSLTKMAYGTLDDDGDYKAFRASLPQMWDENNTRRAWKAANQAKLIEQFDNGDFDENIRNLPDAPISEIQERPTEDDFLQHEGWMGDAKTYYEYMSGEEYTGTPDNLHTWMLQQMSQLNAPTYGGVNVGRVYFSPPPVQQAMYRMYHTYSQTDNTLEQFGRGLGYNLLDPTSVMSLGSGSRIAAQLSKAFMSKVLTSAMPAAFIGAVEGAVYTTLDDFYRQAIPMMAGEQEGYNWKQGGTAAAVGAGAGTVLGAFVAGATSDPVLKYSKEVYQRAKNTNPRYASNTPKSQLGMVSYHGSPHKWDRVDLSKVGTGEGAQIKGWGIYSGQEKDVGLDYQHGLSQMEIDPESVIIEGKNVSEWFDEVQKESYRSSNPTPQHEKMSMLQNLQLGEHPESIIRTAKEDELSDESIKWFSNKFGDKYGDAPGYLYELDIPDESVATMLDLDKPLSEQEASVKSAINLEELNPYQSKLDDYTLEMSDKYGTDNFERIMTDYDKEAYLQLQNDVERYGFSDQSTGDEIYKKLVKRVQSESRLGGLPLSESQAQKQVSLMLLKKGVKGNKYLDAGSREGGKGTQNIVSFDEGDIKVVKRNDKVIAPKKEAPIHTDINGKTIPAYQAREDIHDEVMDLFLSNLPEDASFNDVMEAATVTTPEVKRFLKALEKDDWLGFDYPAQAISTALGEDLVNYEVSVGLKQAIGRLVNSGNVKGKQDKAEKIKALRAESEALKAPVQDDYSGAHKAPSPEGANSMDDMADIYPDDIYSGDAMRYYGAGLEGEQEALEVMQRVAGNPDAVVTIYRAVPRGVTEINAGDWVTPSKGYAESHGSSWVEEGNYDIISKDVKASEIHTSGDALTEWGYNP